MDQKILFELARAWRATAEKRCETMPGGDETEAVRYRGEREGERRQLYDCAEQLEKILVIYSPLLPR